MIFTTRKDIKTDEDLNIYGWEMRIMEAEDMIAILKKNRDKMIHILDGIKQDVQTKLNEGDKK